jgi:hypothetical protein
MHEVAVMKAVPVAGTTVPGCYTATVPRGHVPGPCAHPGAACNCKTAAATPATSHVTSATASMTVSHGERGYQYNRERNQECAHLTLPCLVSDKKTPRVAWSCGRHEVLIILMRRLQKMIRGARGNIASLESSAFKRSHTH